MAIIDTKNSAYTQPPSDPMSKGAFGEAGKGIGGSFGSSNPANAEKPQEGGAEAPSEEEPDLFTKLGLTTGANVIDGAMSGGKIGNLLDLKAQAEKVKAGQKSRKENLVDYSMVDPETGKLVKSELLNMHAEEESGLMNSEAGLISPEAELGRGDEGLTDNLGNTDAVLFADKSGSTNTGPSSAAMMTMDAAGGMNNGGGNPPPRSAGGSAEG